MPEPQSIHYGDSWSARQLLSYDLKPEVSLALEGVFPRLEAALDVATRAHEGITQELLNHQYGFIECAPNHDAPTILVPSALRFNQGHALVGEDDLTYQQRVPERATALLTTHSVEHNEYRVRTRIDRTPQDQALMNDVVTTLTADVHNYWYSDKKRRWNEGENGAIVTCKQERAAHGDTTLQLTFELNRSSYCPSRLSELESLLEEVVIKRMSIADREGAIDTYRSGFRIRRILTPRKFIVKLSVDHNGVRCSLFHLRPNDENESNAVPIMLMDDEVHFDRVVDTLVELVEEEAQRVETFAAQRHYLRSAAVYPFKGDFMQSTVRREIKHPSDVEAAKILAAQYMQLHQSSSGMLSDQPDGVLIDVLAFIKGDLDIKDPLITLVPSGEIDGDQLAGSAGAQQ